MPLATVTSKGQLTIPKKVRESLNLHAGDRVEITVTGNMEAVLKPVSRNVDEMFYKLHKAGRKPVSIEAMDDAIRKRLQSTFQ
ncbi:MAG: AbrB/MazE/SpoVT family DNA-binding domain-containing protein [Deltaproteobacteria bacterium]|nr:AbrB/MazE/SpoVT family DNA-binding domain-containing protein [Candidatus Anaeroferrophillacea bacterium]